MTSPRRLHYLDTCRAVLMMLGIPYHLAIIFSTSDVAVVRSVSSHVGFSIFSGALHSFRMQAFFVIAGYFSLMQIKRVGHVAWRSKRIGRLGIPLLTGLFLLNLPTAVLLHFYSVPNGQTADLLTYHGPGHLAALLVTHLWFLLSLLIFSLLLAAVWPRAGARIAAIADRIADIASRPFGNLQVATGMAAAGIGTALLLHAMQHFLGEDVYTLQNVFFGLPLSYLPFFALGGMLCVSPRLSDALMRHRWSDVALAALSVAIYAYGDVAAPDNFIARMVNVVAANVAGFSVACLLLGVARHHLDKPSKAVRYAVDASLNVYLVHMPIVIVLSVVFAERSGNPLVEFIAAVAFVFAASFLADAIIRRVPWLAFLFSGVRVSPQPASKALSTGAPKQASAERVPDAAPRYVAHRTGEHPLAAGRKHGASRAREAAGLLKSGQPAGEDNR